MSEAEFRSAKAELLGKVAPYYAGAEGSPPRLTLDEFALLAAESPGKVMSQDDVCALERDAMRKMKSEFDRMGLSASDLL